MSQLGTDCNRCRGGVGVCGGHHGQAVHDQGHAPIVLGGDLRPAQAQRLDHADVQHRVPVQEGEGLFFLCHGPHLKSVPKTAAVPDHGPKAGNGGFEAVDDGLGNGVFQIPLDGAPEIPGSVGEGIGFWVR